MNPQDEKIRHAVTDVLSRAGVDVRNLTIEAVDGHLRLVGTLPSIKQQEVLIDLLRARLDGVTSLECDVGLRKVAPQV